MTRPADDQPTTVLPQQTVEQPLVTTSPATRRSYTWHRRIPARIGRARTSTVVISCLFVLLSGLNVALPQRDTGTTPVTLQNGETVEVPTSAIPSGVLIPTSTPADPTDPSPTDEAPAPTSATPTGTRAPSSAPEEDEETETTPTPSSTPRSTPSTTPEPSPSARATATTRAPSTTAEAPSEEQAPEETADPTG